MAPSNKKPEPHRVRAALVLRKVSVRKIARKHGVSDKTLYAVINGERPGKAAKVRAAVREMERLTEESIHA